MDEMEARNLTLVVCFRKIVQLIQKGELNLFSKRERKGEEDSRGEGEGPGRRLKERQRGYPHSRHTVTHLSCDNCEVCLRVL